MLVFDVQDLVDRLLGLAQGRLSEGKARIKPAHPLYMKLDTGTGQPLGQPSTYTQQTKINDRIFLKTVVPVIYAHAQSDSTRQHRSQLLVLLSFFFFERGL